MSEPSQQDQNSMFNSEVNYFGLTNYRNQFRKFGIKTDDRRRHMYVIGKTGMGKTTILENMVLNDIYAGHGIGLVDPHGDFAEKVLNYIPPHRINDIVYFNPSDLDFPVGFNVLESINEEYRHLVASGLMGVFKKIWPDVWSARMEYIMNNSILALIGFPDATLMGINRMLSDEDYREKVISVVKDPVVKAFWDVEFASYSDKYKQEAVAPIQNKIGQFLSASVIRNIVAQVKSTINIREIMDTRKIFIMNLSKGRIGEDSSRLLGGMLITKIQLSAMERVDTPEKERKDFFLYVDEFQNFATESFSNILSEARKYRLDLIMAHQYMEQLEEGVRAAVIGNVGTMAMFRVGSTDADILAKEFAPTFTEEDLVNLPKFHIYLKLMIDGVASRPFSALTLPPIAAATGSLDKVLRVSRERYGTPRAVIEEKIAKWSGVFEPKEPGSGSGGGNSGGGSKAGGSGKPSFGNKSGGGKPSGSFNKNSSSSNSGSKGKPLPPRSSPPPKITSAPPSVSSVPPVAVVNPSESGISLSQISKKPQAHQPVTPPTAQPSQSPKPRVEEPKVPQITVPAQPSSQPSNQTVSSPPSSATGQPSVSHPEVQTPPPSIVQKPEMSSQDKIPSAPQTIASEPPQKNPPQPSSEIKKSVASPLVSPIPANPQPTSSSQNTVQRPPSSPLTNSPKPSHNTQPKNNNPRRDQSSQKTREQRNRPNQHQSSKKIPMNETRNNVTPSARSAEKTVSLSALAQKNTSPPSLPNQKKISSPPNKVESSSTLPPTVSSPPSVSPASSSVPKILKPGEVIRLEE